MLSLLLRAGASDPRLGARLRPLIWLLLVGQLLAGAQRRGGPWPRRPAPAAVRLPRRTLPPHGTVAGRRPRG